MDHELRKTLIAVGTLMAPARHPWWIIGSAAATLHGATTTVRDVDVLLHPDDASRINLLPIALPPHPLFRSQWFARSNANPLAVECMAGLTVSDGTGWRPVIPRDRIPITIDGMSIFVPSRTELIGILKLFGRPKDQERARLLQTSLS